LVCVGGLAAIAMTLRSTNGPAIVGAILATMVLTVGAALVSTPRVVTLEGLPPAARVWLAIAAIGLLLSAFELVLVAAVAVTTLGVS
jgi:hypothetical protein